MTSEKLRPTYKRRVLYDKAGKCLPDNYVDKTFLKGLQKNVNMKTYHIWDSLLNTSVVTQELNSVCSCAVTFVHLDNHKLPPGVLFFISSCLVMICYCIFEAQNSLQRWYEDLKTALVFLAFILGLSPVMKTLTDTVSTDSIYFMSTLLFAVHLVTHDYGLSSNLVIPSLSLAAAIAASVMLASRLATTFYVFELITISIELFALFPLLRRKIQIKWPNSTILFSLILSILGCLAVWTVSAAYAVLLIAWELFISLICPVLFVQWQKYKNNIYGPWDEATIPEDS